MPLDMVSEKTKKPSKPLYKKFQTAKVNFPWLPPLQLQSPTDYLVFSKCSPRMVEALEEIREALILIGSPAFATMKLLHVPGRIGESDRQVAIYARFKGWQTTMKESGMDKQRESTELYAKGENFKFIARSVKVRDMTVRFHIVKGLETYSKMF